MEPQLQSWPRRTIPKALVVSLLLHATLTWVFVQRPEFLFPVPPAPTPEPIPVAFFQPSRVRPTPDPQQMRFDFPDAPASKEKVRSHVRSDRDRKAQTEDRSKRTAPSGAASAPAPQKPVPPRVVPPAQAPPAVPPTSPKPRETPRKPKPAAQPTARPDQYRPPSSAPTPVPAASSEEPADVAEASEPDPTGASTFDQQFEKSQRQKRSGLMNPEMLNSAMGGVGSGPPGPGGDDSQGGLLSFDTQADELGPYARILYQRIKAAWILPNIAQTFAKGVTEVKFTIAKDGRLLEVKVSSSSGWVPLDNAAVNAIRGAAPLPPLPDTFPGDKVGVTFRFFVNVPMPN